MNEKTLPKDLVIAIYRKDCYAGETTLKLEKVLYDEDIPDKYNSYEYKIKLMYLVEYDYRADESKRF